MPAPLRHTRSRVALLALLLAFTAACGSDTDTTAAPAAAPSPSSVPAEVAPEPVEEDLAEEGLAEEDLAEEGVLDAELGDPAFDVEGSVTTEDGRFVAYPDGFKITFVGAERRPDSEPAYDGDPDTTNRVRITLLLENTGSTPITIAPDGPAMAAYGGVNRYEANYDAGYIGSDEARNQRPTRLAPGTEVEFYETFNVEDQSALAVTVNANNYVFSTDSGSYTAYTFTDVEKVLS